VGSSPLLAVAESYDELSTFYINGVNGGTLSNIQGSTKLGHIYSLPKKRTNIPRLKWILSGIEQQPFDITIRDEYDDGPILKSYDLRKNSHKKEIMFRAKEETMIGFHSKFPQTLACVMIAGETAYQDIN
jgi:hypothetical protein